MFNLLRLSYVSIITILLFNTSLLLSQTDRNFWFVAPEVTSGHGNPPGGEPIYLKLSTRTLPADVTIYQPANPAFTPILVNMAANETQAIDLSARIDMIENFPEDQVLDRGIKIESSELITAYYEVGEYWNNDIFSLKGENALGTDYYAPFQNYWGNGEDYTPDAYSRIDIVSTEYNNVITIVPAQDVVGHAAGVAYNVTLDKGETYSAVAVSQDAAGHLGGTKITSTKKIAVTISDDSMSADPHGGCKDINGDQLVPVDIIGKEYIAMRGEANDHMERVFVLAITDTTKVYVDSVLSDNIDEGEIFELELVNNFYHIQTSDKTYAYHIGGFHCEIGGALLPPVDKCTGSEQVGFTRSLSSSDSYEFYLNILVRDGAQDGFILNGDGPNTIINDGQFTQITPDWWAAKLGPFNDAVIPTNAASLIENTKDIFHLGVINGKDGTGNMYGYFSDFNELNPEGVVAGVGSNTNFICHDQTQQFIATGGTSYTWEPAKYLDDPSSPTPIADPDSTTKFTVTISGACDMTATEEIFLFVGDSINTLVAVDDPYGCSPHTVTFDPSASFNIKEFYYLFGDGNDTSFVYSNPPYYPFSHTYINTDTVVDTLDVTIVGTNFGICHDTIYKQIIVYPETNADFDVDTTTGCSPLNINFQNNSFNADYYFWEFGDGASSAAQSPQHEYNNYGLNDTTFHAQLVTYTHYNCSDTADTNITIHPFVEASFVLDASERCSPFQAQLINTSANKGAITSYYWDFGDGSTSTSNNDTIFHTFSDSTSHDTTYYISLTVENAAGCSHTFTDSIKIFRYVDASFIPDTISGCHPLLINFANNSTNADTYNWNFGDGGTSNAINPTHVFENYSSSDTTYRVILTAGYDGKCFDYDTAFITVHPHISACFSIDTVFGCSPFNVEIYNDVVNKPAVNSYLWQFGDGTYSNTSADVFYHEYTNTHIPTPSDIDSIYTLTLTIENNAGCSDQFTDTITVFPEVEASFFHTPPIGCDSLVVQFDASASLPNTGINYDWDFGDGASSTEETPSHMYINNTSDSTDFQVILTTSTKNDRCVDYDTGMVRVYPYINAHFTIPGSKGCSPFTLTFNHSSVNFDSASINFGDGSPDSVLADTGTFYHTYINHGISPDTLQVRLFAASGDCSDEITREIIIFPEVIAGFTSSSIEGCMPLNIAFTDTSTNAATYNWEFGDGFSTDEQNPVHTFINYSHLQDTTYHVSLEVTSENLCKAFADTNITVYPKPLADVSITNSPGCSPHTAEIMNNSVGADSYIVDYGDASLPDTLTSFNTLNHFYEVPSSAGSPQVFTVEVIAFRGSCSDTITRNVTVYPDIEASFATTPIEGCHPLTVEFTNNSQGATHSTPYYWDYGNGSASNNTSSSHSVLFENYSNVSDTVYHVTLTAQSVWDCSDAYDTNITVFAKPLADMAIQQNVGCSPHTSTFVNECEGANLYVIDYGDNTSDTITFFNNLQHTYTVPPTETEPRNFEITLVAYRGECSDTITKTVTVYPGIIASYDANPIEGCHFHTVTFTNTSLGATHSNPYEWNYGDGNISYITNTSHTYTFSNFSHTSNVEYDVQLYAQSEYGCNDTYDTVITVLSNPLAVISVTNSIGCPPLDVGIQNNSSGADSYHIDFGDGEDTTLNQFSNINHLYYVPPTYTTPQVFTIIVTAFSDSCSSTTTRNITVYPDVQTAFTPNPSEGCHPLYVEFANQTLGASTFQWDFDNGNFSSASEPTMTYYNSSHVSDSVFDVNLTATSNYGCIDDTTIPVTIHPIPEVEFTLSSHDGCSPYEVTINNTTVGKNLEYFWDFGDGTTSDTNAESFTHVFHNNDPVTKTYYIELFVISSDGCTDSSTHTFTAYPEVTADFIPKDTVGCRPVEVYFKNNSSLANIYHWDFGDGTYSSETNPVKLYGDTSSQVLQYDVTLISESDHQCTDTVSSTITMHPTPVVGFYASPQVQRYPETTFEFYNETNTGNWGYTWDFDDGTFSTSENPEHTYVWSGNDFSTKEYDVELKADNGQCRDSLTKTVTILAPVPMADFEPSTAGCLNPYFEVEFTDNSTYSQYYKWEYGDGAIDSGENLASVKHKYYSSGKFNVQLTIYSDGGSDSAFRMVTVHKSPIAQFRVEPVLAHLPEEEVKTINMSSLGSEYIWEFGDGTMYYEYEPTHLYEEAGVYDITLIVGNNTQPQCFDTMLIENAVTAEEACRVKFPTAFTPNPSSSNGGVYYKNDPTNDVFYPIWEGFETYHLEIYNRWGEMVFMSDDVNIGWDGYYKGELVKQDVYVWKVEIKCANGNKIIKTGDVTVLY